MTKDILLIVNPISGKGEDTSKRVVSSCLERFPQISIRKTEKKEDAILFARNSKEDIILVAGGDGTLNEVINGIMRRKKKPVIGVLPVGTSNMVARAFDVPRSFSRALDIIEKGKQMCVDVGKANDRYFIVGAGVGVDAQMYKNVEPLVKRFFGEIAYPLALVKTIMTHEPQKLILNIGDKKISCYYVLVCNIGRFSKRFAIVPKTKPDDGLLDVLAFQNKDVLSQFRYCLGLATQKHTDFADVQLFSTARVKVTTTKKAIVHCDAELIGETPVTISCIPRSLSFFVP
jgi:diacylglycerol kinase (ATP)